ncbi:glycopeptide antibiotics resistance protein [Lactobacillus jensenii DSM 20557]|jgi:glycopeptide antibiotics resistance protein|nr:VanZ-like protein [Lactobacillus jensenii 269-3]KRM49668.1 glycopeptide antibiotics resistance protein [Lactobacillus jensenii DSM 20557]
MMIFLGPLYSFLAKHLATNINHFALVKLVIISLDKTIFYFLLFAFLRLLWLLLIRRRRSHLSESLVWVFTFYVMFLLAVTTFRESYFPWQLTFDWNRPLSDINLIFFKETWKLTKGTTLFDFVYNAFGNILCFIPFGFLFPNLIKKKKCILQTVFAGMVLSLFIETMQFGLNTGVSDIDDVFFNTIGAIFGYLVYIFIKKVTYSKNL